MAISDYLSCISCGVFLAARKHSTTFPCPNCNTGIISRCGRCRQNGQRYVCPNPKCDFEGP